MNYVIIGTSQCVFCTKAKDLLTEKGVGFTSYSLDSPSSRWLVTLLKSSGMKTVPQIWDGEGNYIGGYTELFQKLER
jgi:glutaredoxin